MNRQFFCRAYKAEGVYYGTAGQNVFINCDHLIEGVFGMNRLGQEVPLPGASFPTVDPPDVAVPAVIVPPVTEFPNDNQPNLDLLSVTKVKDMVTGAVYWVDTTDYNSKKIQCNPVARATSCPDVSSLSAGTPGATTATITWNEVPGLAGIEWVNGTSPTAPAGDGQFLVAGVKTIALTGLTTATTYHFWIRTICAGGVRNSWQQLTYTTA